jgi:hypothetical protein
VWIDYGRTLEGMTTPSRTRAAIDKGIVDEPVVLSDGGAWRGRPSVGRRRESIARVEG